MWGYGFQAYLFSCKIYIFLFLLRWFLWGFCGAAQQLITLDCLRRAHLSVAVASAQREESSVCLDENVDGRKRCGPRGRSHGEAVSLMCWGCAFYTRASGVCLVALSTTAICIFIHLQGRWGAAVPAQPSLSLLLNIYGSQETRSQQQLFHRHTSFNRLGRRSSQLCLLWFPLGDSSSSKFSLPMRGERLLGFTWEATVPSCGHNGSLQKAVYRICEKLHELHCHKLSIILMVSFNIFYFTPLYHRLSKLPKRKDCYCQRSL